MRVAIVGGGLAGASVAYALAQKGVGDITVFERGPRLAYGASGAAAGILQPVTGRRARLAPWHAEGMLHTLGIADELEVPRLPGAQDGALRVALTEDQAHAWSVRADDMDPEIARWIDATECLALEPAVTPGVLGAVWIPAARALPVRVLVERMCQAAGADVRCGVEAMDCENAGSSVTVRVSSQSSTTQTHTYDALVLCGGLRPPSRDPLIPVKGQVGRFRTDRVPRRVLSSGGFVCSGGAREVLVGATTEWEPFEPGVTPDGIDALHARATKLLGPGNYTPEAVWWGTRPTTKDRVPKLGAIDESGRVFVLEGLGTKGLLLGPIAAGWLADWVTGGSDERDVPSAFVV